MSAETTKNKGKLAQGILAVSSRIKRESTEHSFRMTNTMADPAPAPADTSPPNGAGGGSDKATIAKLSAQLKRLTDANAKYKNLLKLAKDRITTQEEEVETLKADNAALEERLIADEAEASKNIDLDEASRKSVADGETNIVRVCQRIKIFVGGDRDGSSATSASVEEIWALMELEKILSEDVQPAKRFKEWLRFDKESELQDFIRRDTGEPIQLPPYSLSPEQSARVQQAADAQVARITEDFRRFRVKSELARKQADAQIRDLQNHHVRSTAQRIETTTGDNTRSASQNAVVERLRAEMAQQEAHWKESYDALLKENQALQSAGSEALLAAQWRQRYETLLKEKEQLQAKLENSSHTANGGAAAGGGDDKYEAKYRDLKGRIAIHVLVVCESFSGVFLFVIRFSPVARLTTELSRQTPPICARILSVVQKKGQGDL